VTAVLVQPRPARRAADRPFRSSGPIPVFRALSEPLRWELLGHLCRRVEMSRVELEQLLGVSKTMLSYHTRALVLAGLIEVYGSARALTYAVCQEALAELEGWLDDPRSAAPAGREQ
jgi:DNA-binding transcriptional ArsR family regulator